MKNNWISVKDELPKEKQVVLVCSMNTFGMTVKPAIFEIRHYHKKGEGDFSRYHDPHKGDKILSFNWVHITHWMPLPDSPKQKQKCKHEFDLCDGTLENCKCHD